MQANPGHRPFYSDWGFWGVLCGVAAILVSVAIYWDQRDDALSEFRSQARTKVLEEKNLGEALPKLLDRIVNENRAIRREILFDLYLKFSETNRVNEAVRIQLENERKAREADEAAKKQADLEKRKTAEAELEKARIALAAVQETARLDAARTKSEQEARNEIAARRQEKWPK